MRPPFFPVRLEDVLANLSFHGACKKPFTIDSLSITPIPLSHPNRGLGYKFRENRSTFIFLTDNELDCQHPGGLAFLEYVDFCRNADLLVHDAEFTEIEYKKTKGWGHSTVNDALRLAMNADVKRLGLFHHNQERTDGRVDEIVEECRRIVRLKKSSLKVFAVAAGSEIEI